MTNINFSVVIPVYNGEQTLEVLFIRLKKVLLNNTFFFELIFVDDYSDDRSWEILKKLQSNNSTIIKIIRLSANFGQHNAILCGLHYTNGEIVITMDDDLQHPPEEIPKLIEAMNLHQPDLIYGIDSDYHPKFRNFSSNIMKWISEKLMKQQGEWSSFRLIKKSLITHILKHKNYFVNIDQIALKYTNKINFVQVNMVKRTHGKSGYSLIKLFSSWSHAAILYFKIPLKLISKRSPFIIKEEIV